MTDTAREAVEARRKITDLVARMNIACIGMRRGDLMGAIAVLERAKREGLNFVADCEQQHRTSLVPNIEQRIEHHNDHTFNRFITALMG